MLGCYLPGKQAGARKAFLGLRAWSFQKLLTSCITKLQPSVSACFNPSSLRSKKKNVKVAQREKLIGYEEEI